MEITPDKYIVFQNEFIKINHTILYTWLIMAVVLAFALTLRFLLTHGKDIGKLQNIFEVLITGIEGQINEMGKVDLNYVFPFIATLFIFIAFGNLLQIIPFFESPNASLSTTVALVIMVVCMGIFYGVKRVGVVGYLKKYTKPSIVMLPMNIISDISSNCALAIRLYGNMMSGMIIGAVMSGVAFLAIGLPIFLNILSFITSIIQAYIFSILALVFILSAED